MTALLEPIEHVHLDALRELVNVGTGHAAMALEEMTSGRFWLTAPSAGITALNEFHDMMGGPEAPVVGIYMPVTGDLRGHMAYLMRVEVAEKMKAVLCSTAELEDNQLDDVGDSVFTEVSNVILSSFLNALADMTGMALHSNVPAIAIDMADALINSVASASEAIGSHHLTVAVRLREERNGLDSMIVLIPEPASLPLLFERLGLEAVDG